MSGVESKESSEFTERICNLALSEGPSLQSANQSSSQVLNKYLANEKVSI